MAGGALLAPPCFRQAVMKTIRPHGGPPVVLWGVRRHPYIKREAGRGRPHAFLLPRRFAAGRWLCPGRRLPARRLALGSVDDDS